MSLSKQDEFLIKEYETAVELTNHIDELRNKMTSFYMIFAGAALAGIIILLKGEAKETLSGNIYSVVSVFLTVISFIGIFVVLGLARIRGVQIEHFRIITNIRKKFLGDNYKLWNAVQLSGKTLPKPNRLSGSYMWLLMVISTSSCLFSIAVYLLSLKIFLNAVSLGIFAGGLGFVLFSLFLDFLYFKFSIPRSEEIYSETNPPA